MTKVGKPSVDLSLDDLDELLDQLTEEELLELNGECDPDNSLLPPSQRMKDQTDKAPTGPFNRKKLLKFLEEQAKKEADWEQNKPFVHEIRGFRKIYRRPDAKQEKLFEAGDAADGDLGETEWDAMLEKATEEELVDLAAVLGFYSIMNQDQYNASLENKTVEGDFRGVAKATKYPVLPMEAPNDTDVDAAVDQIVSDDAEMKELNINNIKNISIEKLKQLCEGLAKNTHLKKLHMANTATTDKIAKVLANALSENKTLEHLNVESNFISGESIISLLQAVNEHCSITEIKLANQRSPTFGVRTEMKIAELVEKNETLTTVGLHFDVPNARNRVQQHLQRNRDKAREKRSTKS